MHVSQLEKRMLWEEGSIRDLSMVDSFLEGLDEFARGAEDLELIIFCGAHHEPGVVFVPVKIADTVSKATVHEQAS
jgi:hypothetical protein